MSLADFSQRVGAALVDPHYRHPRVVKTDSCRLTIEQGDPLSLRQADKIAVFSSWSAQPIMSLSFSRYLLELEVLGYSALIVSTSAFEEEHRWPHGKPASTVVFRRENIGYDFGSWASALHALPWIAKAPRVLLTNDSMVGPFSSLEAISKASARSNADIFSLTESLDMAHHPQSFFLEFRGGILADRPWQRFFNSVRPQDQKMSVVEAYETRLGDWAIRHGYSWEPMLSGWFGASRAGNPTLESFAALLDTGAPFIKRNILTEDTFPVTALKMAQTVQDRYGQDVRDWLPPGYSLPGEPQKETSWAI